MMLDSRTGALFGKHHSVFDFVYPNFEEIDENADNDENDDNKDNDDNDHDNDDNDDNTDSANRQNDSLQIPHFICALLSIESY